MRKTMTKEFRTAVVAVENAINQHINGADLADAIEMIALHFEDEQFSDADITGPILDHAFADFHEVADVESIRRTLESALKERENRMKKFYGLYEVAAEIFNNVMWDNMDALVYAADAEDTYHVGYRVAYSFGTPEHESDIVCYVNLSPENWNESLAEWGIDPDLIGTTDLDDDLIHDYITGAMVDHIRYQMDLRAEGREHERLWNHD